MRQSFKGKVASSRVVQRHRSRHVRRLRKMRVHCLHLFSSPERPSNCSRNRTAEANYPSRPTAARPKAAGRCGQNTEARHLDIFVSNAGILTRAQLAAYTLGASTAWWPSTSCAFVSIQQPPGNERWRPDHIISNNTAIRTAFLSKCHSMTKAASGLIRSSSRSRRALSRSTMFNRDRRPPI